MKRRIRRKFEMADRVLVFNQNHPSTDSGLAPLFDGLAERVAHATVLEQANEEARSRGRAGNLRRGQLRRRLTAGLLRLIAQVGQAAAQEDPSLAGLFQPVLWKTPGRSFSAAAEALVAAAKDHLDLLTRHGFTQALLDEATAMVTEYAQLTAQASAAQQARIQAGAELERVGGEIGDLVARIDGLNQHRFGDDPEVLAAWRSARNIIGPSRPAHGAEPEVVNPAPDPNPASANGPTPPEAAWEGEGDVQAAA